MFSAVLHIHSVLRYVVLALILFTIIKSMMGLNSRKSFSKGDERLAFWAMLSVHIEFTVGLVLYFLSPIIKGAMSNMGASMGDTVTRFFLVEHFIGMLIALVLITVGRKKALKALTDQQKYKKLVVFFGVALFIIFISIPWPFMTAGLGRGWIS
jgi:hypothetical protein